jgi:Rrf2 family protein
MDIIRKETDYAFRCLVRLAGLAAGSVENVSRIATEEALPEPLLRKVLQRLVKSGIAASVKGRSGGVRLAREPDQISLHDVLESVQGQVSLNQCVRPGGCCKDLATCRLHRSIKRAQTGIDKILGETTLQDLLDD